MSSIPSIIQALRSQSFMANSAYAPLLLQRFIDFNLVSNDLRILVALLLCSWHAIVFASGSDGGGHAAAQSRPDRRTGTHIIGKA